MREFILGFKSPLIGIKMILANKELKRIAIVPLLIDVVLFFGVLYVSLFMLMPILMASLLTGAAGFWAGVVYYGSYALATIVIFILSGFITFALAMIVSGPFNALLAEKTLVILGSVPKRPESFGKWFSHSVRMFFVSLLRAIIVLCFTSLMFFMGIIPGLGAIAIFMSLFIYATDCADYSLEIMGANLQGRFRVYRAHWLGFSGFGLALGLTFLVPGLSFLIMPAAVVGGTHFVHEILKK